jgi:hypothetical protein
MGRARQRLAEVRKRGGMKIARTRLEDVATCPHLMQKKVGITRRVPKEIKDKQPALRFLRCIKFSDSSTINVSNPDLTYNTDTAFLGAQRSRFQEEPGPAELSFAYWTDNVTVVDCCNVPLAPVTVTV